MRSVAVAALIVAAALAAQLTTAHAAPAPQPGSIEALYASSERTASLARSIVLTCQPAYASPACAAYFRVLHAPAVQPAAILAYFLADGSLTDDQLELLATSLGLLVD